VSAQLEESDWRVLLKSIRQGKCIPLLGPGVALDPANPKNPPLSIQLAQRLATELRREGKGNELPATHDLAEVAQIYKHQMRRRRAGLELTTEDFYAPYRDKTTQLHLDLAALPFALCISTTPERFLLNAFDQTLGKKPIYEFYHFQPDPKRSKPPALAPLPTISPERRPLIYDLYGSIEQTDSLVLTENDLLDFLVNVTRQTPPLHAYVTALFSDPTVSFLFLGFGFKQWYMRILLHALKAGGHESQSLALEDTGFFSAPDHQRTTLFFQNGHAIEFRLLPEDFTSELRRRFDQQTLQTQQLKEAIPPPPDNAPIVFLCHENRDKSIAEALTEDFQRRGIKVWLDNQSLRGGDDWTKLIPHVVGKQTDYVVVLQSPQMIDKPEGYFKTEIHYALERQLSFGDFLFTIPVLLEPHPNLPLRDLAHLHWIDFTQPDGPAVLAETIQEDWRKRETIKGPK
jgi:TIR domain/SIR2-like domain